MSKERGAKRHQHADAKSPDYQLKDKCIAAVGLANKNADGFDNALLTLGQVLTYNPLLSNAQTDWIHSHLEEAGLLPYQENYLKEEERLLEEIPDGSLRSQAQETHKKTLDTARWEMEDDAKLQVNALITAAQLTNAALSPEDRLERVTGLFTSATLATKKGRIANYTSSDSDFQEGIKNLEQVEQQAYQARTDLVKKLASLHKISVDEAKTIVALSFEEFTDLRYSGDVYDKLIVLQVFPLEHTSMRTTFTRLQDVLYLGFTTGVKDARIANSRYDELAGRYE